jgi:hypothetical protein
MNDLHTWLSQQHHGLRTFRTFQQKLDDVCRNDPEQRALCRLLNTVVGSYVDTFDEEPLPVAVADRAYGRLLDLVASLDFSASADRRLADANRVAALDLRHQAFRYRWLTGGRCFRQGRIGPCRPRGR